jgi:hypothetical protein
MAIKIPEDAKPARVPDLDLLVGLDAFYKRIVEGDKGIKEKIKEPRWARRGAEFAESDIALASLRGGSQLSAIDAEQLYELVDAKKGPTLTIEQFLECATIRVEPLKQYLSGETIDGLRGRVADQQPRLVTEFKPGIVFDVDGAAADLVKLIKDNIKAA